MRFVSTRWSLSAAGLISALALAACAPSQPAPAPAPAPVVTTAPPMPAPMVAPPGGGTRRRGIAITTARNIARCNAEAITSP